MGLGLSGMRLPTSILQRRLQVPGVFAPLRSRDSQMALLLCTLHMSRVPLGMAQRSTPPWWTGLLW